MNEELLTDRELVREIRQDVKNLALGQARIEMRLAATDNHEERIRALEGTRIALRGAWATVAIIGGVIAGGAGLVIGVIGLLP